MPVTFSGCAEAEASDRLIPPSVTWTHRPDRPQPLRCCLLPPTSNFGFLHLAVVKDGSVYSCNGSKTATQLARSERQHQADGRPPPSLTPSATRRYFAPPYTSGTNMLSGTGWRVYSSWRSRSGSTTAGRCTSV